MVTLLLMILLVVGSIILDIELQAIDKKMDQEYWKTYRELKHEDNGLSQQYKSEKVESETRNNLSCRVMKSQPRTHKEHTQRQCRLNR